MYITYSVTKCTVFMYIYLLGSLFTMYINIPNTYVHMYMQRQNVYTIYKKTHVCIYSVSVL